MLALDAPAAAVKEFERNMRLNEDVLRLMTIRVDELDAEPSVMMRNKNSRDERSRRDDRSDNKPAPKPDAAPEAKTDAAPEAKMEAASTDAATPAENKTEGEDK
jgi:small subunit ribosomal protein S6